MSSIFDVLGGILFLLGVMLLFLQIYANYNLLESDSRKSQLSAISFNWFLKEEIFNSQGQKACGAAKKIWITALPILVVWIAGKYI